LMLNMQEVTSLNTEINDSGDDLLSCLADHRNDLFEDIHLSVLRENIDSALSFLGERERTVVRMRYGLAGEEAASLETVGRKLGITRERVRQIQNKAIRKLGFFEEIRDFESSR
jgi:RNA polymerase primary sigma factor